MSERVRRLGAPILLLAVLAIGLLIPTGLDLADPESPAAVGLDAVLAALPDEPTVLVGFDPDLGTYAEIRPTVRTLVAALAERGAAVAMISLTPEGRALALAERGRIDRLASGALGITELGFVPGAEAALVTVARAIAGSGEFATPEGPATLETPDLIVVVGGNDLGPRSWVEQVQPRVEAIPIVAITPAALLPEVEPYRASGQLAALIATPRDGASYRAAADLGAFDVLGDVSGGPPALAVLVGLLAAVSFLGDGLVRRVLPGLAPRPERDRP
jgi:hypothetical protein